MQNLLNAEHENSSAGMSGRPSILETAGMSGRPSILERDTLEGRVSGGGSEVNSVFTDIDDSMYQRTSDILGKSAAVEDEEEDWTQSLINLYVVGDDEHTTSDLPMPFGFAQEYRFWLMVFTSMLMGGVMGLAAVGFMNAADYVPKLWANNGDAFTKSSQCIVNAGQLHWIGITAGTGLIVGLIRYFTAFPPAVAGLFKEINDCHVDSKWSIHTFLISAISLAGGASLGPEQALSNLGGGLGNFIKEDVFINNEKLTKDDQKLLVLSGMSSALGALFPTPLLGVLMILELGNPPGAYMESIIIMSAGALTSFTVYYALIDPYTKVEHMPKSLMFAYTWDFDITQLGTAVIIGLVSGCLSLLSVVMIGACKQIFGRLRMRLREKKRLFLEKVLPPVIGGVVIGAVNYALPLTIGGGSMVSKAIVTLGHNYVKGPGSIPEKDLILIPAKYLSTLSTLDDPGLSTNLLLCSLFAKMFVMGVSMNSGFIGGFVYPTITMGTMAAVICFQLFDTLPMGLCMCCFISAVPAGICPMPFTMAALTIFVFNIGLYQTVPVYVATLVSYILVCGTGIFTKLTKNAQKRQKVEEEKSEQKIAAKAAKKIIKKAAQAEIDHEDYEENNL